MAVAGGGDRVGDLEPDLDPDPVPDAGVPRPVVLTWADLWARAARARWFLAAGAVALLVAGAGVAGYALLRPPDAPATELLLPRAGEGPGAGAPPPSGASSTTAAPAELVVHAAGAVAVPGVHRLPVGSRVGDLLAAAGGPTGEADLDRVNLAAALADGERIWFPRVGEQEPSVVAGERAAPAEPGAPGVGAGGLVDINQATTEELDTLPGVGPATASAIIEHRERNGPFRTVEDLLAVPGIGDAKLAQLRDLVRV
jgi:competence protein ComEA